MQSLDILRGITVAVMILVNNNGSGDDAYRTLMHSRWNGCTLADVVFPTFLFIVGTSLVFSFRARLSRGESRHSLMAHVVKRAAIIFLLGLLINTFPFFQMDMLRIYGVLQRIALCFLCASTLTLYTRVRTSAILFVAILCGYWALLRLVPVPGFGVPCHEIPFLDPVRNIVAWTDRHLLPARHLYRQSFYDPEGLLSTVSAIATTLLGVLTGHWLLSSKDLSIKARGLCLAAFACLASACLWSPWFPFNKRLWTSSYVLLTGGIALFVLAALYFLVDVRRLRSTWAWPAIVFGSNALTAYIFSELFASTLQSIHTMANGQSVNLSQAVFLFLAAHIHNPAIASLGYSVLFVLVCFLPVWVLYRKRIFLKV
nr:DUF5009 domain-containing protein [Granulicella arctica]